MNIQSIDLPKCEIKVEKSEGSDIDDSRFVMIFENFIQSQKLCVVIAQLTKAARIINMKLQEHRYKDAEGYEQTNVESKRTKRNSQYQSMATNIVWYLAYLLHYGREPELMKDADGSLVYDNRNKTRYTDSAIDARVRPDWDIDMVRTIKLYMIPLVQRFYRLYNEKNIELQKTRIEKNVDRQLNMYTKLYMAILTELDQEILHKYLHHLLVNKAYVKITIIEILKCCIDRTIKQVYPRKQAESTCSIYHDILKNEEFTKINTKLIEFASIIKYNEYGHNISKNDDDLKPIDLKKFPIMNRFNKELYIYTSKEPLELQIESYQTNKSRTYEIIKFIQASNTHIFDVLSNGTRVFNKMSWQDRLKKIDPRELTNDYKIITVRPIPYEAIQFNMITSNNDSSYQYIRTSGLGHGTLFINVGRQAKRNRLTSSINKRHKKVKREDLEPCTYSNINSLSFASSNLEDVDLEMLKRRCAASVVECQLNSGHIRSDDFM